MNNEIRPPIARLSYRTPGVYYETLAARSSQPTFHTGIPVFVGFARWKSDGRETSGIHHLTRWQQFREWYEILPDYYLGYAVRGFFENGGNQCVVVPVESDQNDPAIMTDALINAFARGGVLDDIENIDLVCVPDAMFIHKTHSIREADHASILEVQTAILEHCLRMGDRFAILDGFPHNDDKPIDAQQTKNSVDMPLMHWRALPPEHGALYFPWIAVKKFQSPDRHDSPHTASLACDELIKGNNTEAMSRTPNLAEFVPPCGHIAGIYSRTDSRVGVHKAPANEVVENILDLEFNFTDKEQGELNQSGVNCLRSFAGRGIRVWGGRTLNGQRDWSYINVRRQFLTLTRWLRQNMNDLIFEPNDPLLWDRVRQRLTAYCRDLFDRGALMGASPAQAFFVKCDAETNTRENRETGLVIADVGLAPVVPAEFVVVRITQSASAVAVTGMSIL